MNKLSILAVFVFLCSFESQAQGRLGSKLLDKLTQPKTEESTPEEEPVQIKQTPKGVSVQTEDGTVTIEEDDSGAGQPNSFIGSFVMNIEVTEKGKTERSKMAYAFRKWETSIKPQTEGQSEELTMIFDLRTKKMTMLTVDKKGAKTGVIMKMPKITFASDKIDEKIEESASQTTIKKTGEKKVIEGYTCEKWIITSPEGVAESWVTDEVNFNMANAFNFFNASAQSGKGKKSFAGADLMMGFALETTFKGNKGEVSVMKVQDIKIGEPSAASFSTAGYQMTDVSSFGGMFGR